jgi:hypothetical protein
VRLLLLLLLLFDIDCQYPLHHIRCNSQLIDFSLNNVPKVDLLPKDYTPDRVKQWVLDECRLMGFDRLRLSDIHLISAQSGEVGSALVQRTLFKINVC